MTLSEHHELHTYEESSFPFIFHLDTIKPYQSDFLSHWHENIEILYVVEGTIIVRSDSNAVKAYKDEIVFINSNHVHHIQGTDQESKYYCLIVDCKFCEEYGLYPKEIAFEQLVRDAYASMKFLRIRDELKDQKPLYQSVVKALIVDLLIYNYRNYSLAKSPLPNKKEIEKIDIIKKAIRYMQDNYENNISITDIAAHAGLSKYYFCRLFKEFTGCTIVFYLNVLRCINAKNLLQSGNYLVEEAALMCGFENLSYFTKTYKKYMGCLPSVSKKRG